MARFCLFAGTAEGRALAALLSEGGAEAVACVATEYGEALLPPAPGLRVRTGRMDQSQMAALLSEESFDLVLDATHPYAAEATEHIRAACAETGREYLRLLRDASGAGDGAVYVPDAAAAAAYLEGQSGNVLLTTGSKELGVYAAITDFASRVWARVLPLEDSISACRKAGLPPAHIIAMQGPFSEEMNTALLRACGARYLVTKDGGVAGGFAEKAAAAAKEGAHLVIVGRPPQREGKTLAETAALLRDRFGLTRRQRVTVAGIGPGSPAAMTGDARDAIAEAECLIGAKRMLHGLARPGQLCREAVAPEKIAAEIAAHPELGYFTVLMSGDTGFFSGAKKLLPLLADREAQVLPGLSSLSCLCARLGTSYEDVVPVSLHGRERDIAADVRRHRRVFALTGGENGAGALCRRLADAGLGCVRVFVGEQLSYPGERVTAGTAAELAEMRFDSLSAVLIENPSPDAPVTPGLPDDTFQRIEGVPMTKSEVRALCLSKLRLTAGAVCWDVGAGTGSVSVEMALLARQGRVWAVERSEKALEALTENARLAPGNLEIIPGAAPAACEALPAPTHVFIGGSGGQAREIIALAIQKNPAVRIVATAVTLESVAELTACMSAFPFSETEAVSLTVARDRKAGPYHLMLGQNPIHLFTMQAGAARI